LDNPKGPKKIVHASDAYFCCHEFEKDGQLDMEKSRNGVKGYRIGLNSALTSKNSIKRDPNDSFGSIFVYNLRG
jgi:hypothetical protein